jgi:Tol biopolymer transport system component
VSADDVFSLWTADAGGRRMTRLATSINAQPIVVTPDDRFVLFNAIVGGTLSIWMVPIGGGAPTRLAAGGSVAVSPDGESMAFTGPPRENRAALMVCSLPGCSSPRTVGSAEFAAPLGYTPDGRGIAYSSEGNLWVQALDGGAPRQLTRFTDSRPIGSFAWSRDGKRLAIARSTVTNDIVLFQGLK